MEIPDTQYAWNGDAALAYQILGDGPIDLLYIDLLYMDGDASYLDLNWASHRYARFLRGLAHRTRLIVSDRRGCGLSERYDPDISRRWRARPMTRSRCWTPRVQTGPSCSSQVGGVSWPRSSPLRTRTGFGHVYLEFYRRLRRPRKRLGAKPEDWERSITERRRRGEHDVGSGPRSGYDGPAGAGVVLALDGRVLRSRRIPRGEELARHRRAHSCRRSRLRHSCW